MPPPYHVVEHHSARSNSPQPHTEQSSRPGSEPPSILADVYAWHYEFLVVHARKEEEDHLEPRRNWLNNVHLETAFSQDVCVYMYSLCVFDKKLDYTHTDTLGRLTAFSRTIWVGWYQKDKPFWIL